MKIAAVVVTFNRLNLLKECIKGIREQTRKLDEIIVVNNSSTDGTLEWLEQQEDLTVITQTNSGSAGGQYTGIKTAYEKGYDWIWCMDDDCLPEKYCLENQIPDSKYVITGPLVVFGDEKVWNYDYSGLKYKILKFLKVPYTTIPFNGFLVSNEIIQKVGLPIKEFFIYCDDVEYSYRIQKLGYEAKLCHNAQMNHPISKINVFSSVNKTYYYIRNNIIVSKNYDFLYLRTLFKVFNFIKNINKTKERIVLKGIQDGLKFNLNENISYLNEKI